jgi:transposase
MESDHDPLNEDLSELTKVEPMRRIELITGAERRRKRSRDEKAAIVAESLLPGAVIAEVARRHGLSPQQLYGWRSSLKAQSIRQRVPTFSPIVVDGSSAVDDRQDGLELRTETPLADTAPSIELTIGQTRVVIRGTVNQDALGVVLKALKGLA